jgi:hypothetical protein
MTAATASGVCPPGISRESSPPCTAAQSESGPHHTGRHQADLDPGMLGLHLLAHHRGEGVEVVLRGGVGGADEVDGQPAEHRRDVDDVSDPALTEMRQHFLHSVERRLHVDLHHQIDVLVGQLCGYPADAAADVVDPDVDVTEPRERGLHDPAHIGAAGHVGDDRFDVGTRAGGHRRQGIGAARHEHERMTGGAQLFGGGRANAGAGPGNHDDTLLHPSSVVRPQRADWHHGCREGR